MAVISFPNFPNKLLFEVGDVKDAKYKCDKHAHSFVHGIDIVIPDLMVAPPDIRIWPGKEFEYYRVDRLPLANLIEKEFIEAFVKRGTFHLLSIDTCVDLHDTVAVLPNGTLYLNLCKDSYQTLGLEGKQSQFKKLPKYVVEVNLTANYFTPGKKNYERTKQIFTARDFLIFNCLVYWRPHEERISSSSIARYFESKRLAVSSCTLKHTSKVRYNESVPNIDPSSHKGEESHCDFLEVHEWLGALCCNIDTNDALLDQSSCSLIPDSCSPVGHMYTANWRGFIPKLMIAELLQSLRLLTTSKESTIPWAAFTVYGFDDSPIGLGNSEHGFHKSGDNIQTIIIFSNDCFWRYTASATHDVVS